MIIVPKERPIIENLNSYYLDISKLVEHYQGDIGAGGIHLKGNAIEAALFFDDHGICGGTLQERQKTLLGEDAVNRIFKIVSSVNFGIAVYAIELEMIHFWSNLSQSEEIYSNLTTEFTDLEGLLNKIISEKRTGYVDIRVDGDRESGLIFIFEGNVAGSSCSWESCSIDSAIDNKNRLVEQSRKHGAVFSVYQSKTRSAHISPKVSTPAPEKNTPVVPSKARLDAPLHYLEMSGDFIATLEKLFMQTLKSQEPFSLTLKRKFIENAEDFDFLDPFAGEFSYDKGKIIFQGEAPHVAVATGVFQCLMELSDDLGLHKHFSEALKPLKEKYKTEFDQMKTGLDERHYE